MVRAVQDSVQLRVADIHIFCVKVAAFALPGHIVVIAADGHAVVAQGQNFVFRADDAGTDLAVVVFGPHGREQGNAHKVFIPADVILTFHRYTVLYFLLYYTVPLCAAQDAVCKYLRRVASPPRR